LTVTELAQKLRHAHPSVGGLVAKMKKKGYVESHRDAEDGRKQRIALSQKALDGLPGFEQIWAAGARAMEGLFARGQGAAFMETLNALDERLAARSFAARTLDQLARDKGRDIRQAMGGDEDAIWEIFRQVIAAGDTYAIAPDAPREALSLHWLAPQMHTYVCERDGQVVGTYILKPNQGGGGGHVANAAFMVHPEARRQGLGDALCQHALDEARRLGFAAIQFNLVVSTNAAAIALWRKHGFQIIGTTPQAFQHPTQGLVDAHIMHRML